MVSFLQDFLRQNNTGKLLWQVFGTEAATLCLFGIAEQEEIMWDAFKLSGLFVCSCFLKLIGPIIVVPLNCQPFYCDSGVLRL